VWPWANAHNMLLCFKRLVGGPTPADINHKSTQNMSCKVHSDSARDVICNGLGTGESLTRKSKQAVFSQSPVDARISPIPCGYCLGLLNEIAQLRNHTNDSIIVYGIIGVVSELSDLIYFLYITFAHTMMMLPIINKLKFLSYQQPTAYRYGSWPERSGGIISADQRSAGMPYRLTPSPRFATIITACATRCV